MQLQPEGMTEAEINSLFGTLTEIRDLLRALANREPVQERPARLLKIAEAADYLHCSRWKVRGLISRGELSLVRVHARNGHAPHLLDVRDLDAYIERQKD